MEKKGSSLREEAVAEIDPNVEPDMGKANILYRIQMPCGTVWMARLHNSQPGKSTITDEKVRLAHERKLLESEIATMKFVRANTYIPVPEIYGFSISDDNELGMPYIIMECMPGKPHPFPFEDRGVIKDTELAKIHRQLIEFQRQLLRLPFNQI